MYDDIDSMDPEYVKNIMRAYNNVFTGGDGPVVINHMLWELGFFDQPIQGKYEPAAEDRVRQDYAKRILMWMGILREGNYTAVVETLLKLPPQYPEQEEEENAS